MIFRTFEQFLIESNKVSEDINESKFKGYNLDFDTKEKYKYEKEIAKAVRNIPGIKDYDKMSQRYGRTAVTDIADRIRISQYGNKDVTKQLKKALKDIDPNLDLDSITNNLNAGPDQRSQNDKDQDIWWNEIKKKEGFWDFKKKSKQKGKPDTEMSDDVIFNLLDMMAQYSSTQDQLANVKWDSLDGFMQAAADHMSATNLKKFKSKVKKEYPKLK